MKELSIEQKAKAYDNVRKKITTRFGSNVAKEIFSDYEESEDEKIKKEITELVMQPTWKTEKEFYRRKELCDWLEKQKGTEREIEGNSLCNGEQKPVISYDALREGIAHFGITQYQIANWLKKYVDVEKQWEQKPYGQREECLDCQMNYAGECKGSCAMKKIEQKPAWSEEDDFVQLKGE